MLTLKRAFAISASLLMLVAARLAHADVTPPSPIDLDRLVVITDSHGVGRFGEALVESLRQRPRTEFDFVASGGSAPLQWLNNAFNTPCGFSDNSTIEHPAARSCQAIHTPRLRDLWAKHELQAKPASERRVSLIALGTNYGMSPSMHAEQLAATQLLIEDAQKHSDVCIWIGPPNMIRSPGFDAPAIAYKYQIIEAAIASAAKKTGKPACELVDSRMSSHYPTKGGDGIHYHWPGWKQPETLEAAQLWAQSVFVEVEQLLNANANPDERTDH